MKLERRAGWRAQVDALARAICAAGVMVLAVSAGCGSDVVGEVGGWAERACACKDAECAVAVRTEFSSWIEAKRSVRGSRTERVEIEKAAKRLFKCIDEHGVGGPTAAPSTPQPTPPDREDVPAADDGPRSPPSAESEQPGVVE